MGKFLECSVYECTLKTQNLFPVVHQLRLVSFQRVRLVHLHCHSQLACFPEQCIWISLQPLPHHLSSLISSPFKDLLQFPIFFLQFYFEFHSPNSSYHPFFSLLVCSMAFLISHPPLYQPLFTCVYFFTLLDGQNAYIYFSIFLPALLFKIMSIVLCA